MKRYLILKIFERYSVNLIGSLLFALLCVVAFEPSIISKTLLAISILYFIIYIFVLFNKINLLNQALKSEKNLPFKVIENTIFTDNKMISFSYNKIVDFPYNDVVSVQHGENSWENVWSKTKYSGNHKVSIQSNQQLISIIVKDKDVAYTLMNFIHTKNQNCRLLNFKSEYKMIDLDDLENWNVKNRFGDST